MNISNISFKGTITLYKDCKCKIDKNASSYVKKVCCPEFKSVYDVKNNVLLGNRFGIKLNTDNIKKINNNSIRYYLPDLNKNIDLNWNIPNNHQFSNNRRNYRISNNTYNNIVSAYTAAKNSDIDICVR